MSKVHEHIQAYLGKKTEDKVTGFLGVITSVAFDINGCVTAFVSRPIDEKGEIKDGRWFDVTRLKLTSRSPIIDLPNFDSGYIADGKKGASFKGPK